MQFREACAASKVERAGVQVSRAGICRERQRCRRAGSANGQCRAGGNFYFGRHFGIRNGGNGPGSRANFQRSLGFGAYPRNGGSSAQRQGLALHDHDTGRHFPCLASRDGHVGVNHEIRRVIAIHNVPGIACTEDKALLSAVLLARVRVGDYNRACEPSDIPEHILRLVRVAVKL